MPSKRHFRKYETWLAHRKYFIGASETATILGYGYAGLSPLELYANKTRPEPIEDNFSEAARERMRLGLAVEGGLLQMLGERLELSIRQQGRTTYHSDDHAYIGATPDGLIDSTIPVDIKNVSTFAAGEWKGEQTPVKFLIQMQHQMFVMGADHSYIAGNLANERLVHRRIERDDKFIELMLEELIKFWDRIQNKNPPDPDESDACRSAIHRMYPVSDPAKAIELPQLACEVLDDRDQGKAKEKEAKAIYTAAENKIKAALGEATYAVLPDGRIIKWATEQGREDQFCPGCGEQVSKGYTRRVLRVMKALPKNERLDYVEANPVPGLTHDAGHEPAEQTAGGLPRPAGDVHDGGDTGDGNANSGDRPELPFQGD